MKLATSSSAFADLFASGGATHLEWLEWCAQNADLDGVVFARSDFPRLDPDYLAQVKKIATDVGLSVVAIRDDTLLREDVADADIEHALALATTLGAPFVMCGTGPRGDVAPATFSATVRAAHRAGSLAKKANVTLAVRALAGTVADDAETLVHLVQHVDSAWLRILAQPLLEGTLVPSPRSRIVLAYAQIVGMHDAPKLAETLRSYRGWAIVDAVAADPRERLKTATRDLRRAFAESFLMPTA